MSLADELERLGNATESGDWYADSLGYIPSAGVTDVHSGDRRGAEFMPKADAALIVALRNNLPAIIEALRAQEWRDIETAPRDEVLLYFPKIVTGAHRQSFLPEMYRIGRASDTPNRRPTHWRPLPASPRGEPL